MFDFEFEDADCQQELTPDQLYDLQCAQEDMRREEMLATWGVETWEELEALGHDW